MKRLIAFVGLATSSPCLAVVPMEIAKSGHATVPVEGIFGKARFVLDTGAEGTAIYGNFADDKGLKAAGTEALQGQTGIAEVPLVKLGALSLDGTVKQGIAAVRLDPRADGVPLAGIVGLDVFGDRTIDFDLPSLRLAVLEPGKLPDGISGAPVLATPTVGHLLTIPVSIRGVEAVAVIDTGARKTRINWELGRLIGINPASVSKGDVIQGATNTAVETGATRVSDVRMGTRNLADAPVLVADLPVFEAFGVADKPAIILGLDWLTETRMIIDFPGRRVWFEAAKNSLAQ